MHYIPVTFGISTITIATYIISTFTLTPDVSTQLFFIFLFGLFLYVYIGERSPNVILSTQIITLLLTGTIISLVASTGWFESPFSFMLYFLIVVLSIFFPPYASMVFVSTLLGIAAIANNDENLSHIFLTLLSLLACVPISLYIRTIYLDYKQSQKEILILKKRFHKHYYNHAQEILDNAIDHFATDLRGEIGIIKQLSYELSHEHDHARLNAELERLDESVARALRAISYFEEETTGNKMIPSKIHDIPQKTSRKIESVMYNR
ncbi:hypothetical protein HY469_05415 [Candidatus Roizmanbacteria bacterium]|nr:hypothetical protein [Candidatus Roizmanbacteria bacterium]